ncbi:response regulator [Bacillus sp. CGMCC 1.16541]|uniref:response regulator n=1 Tax=Bacillus sp. CGMCC 1.16541 TaxID=2185143 RepID=UPI000D73B4C5|nr:response regulator [Bacillus sp. CGMCC 1.16541]
MNKTILIADDSLFMRRWLTTIVKEHGFNVISEASNGIEAVEQYKVMTPSIVLLDITMPEQSGLIALEKIKEIDKHAKVIMCSAMGQRSMILEALKYGATDFVIKPYFEKLPTILNNISKAG